MSASQDHVITVHYWFCIRIINIETQQIKSIFKAILTNLTVAISPSLCSNGSSCEQES